MKTAKTAFMLAILSTISSASAFDMTSANCPASLKVETNGELRRFSYCAKADAPASCRVLGERGWYTVADLEAQRKSRRIDAVIGGLLAAINGTVATAAALTTPFTAGGSLVVLVPFAGGAVGGTMLMLKNADMASALDSDFIADKDVQTQNSCAAMETQAAILENVLALVN